MDNKNISTKKKYIIDKRNLIANNLDAVITEKGIKNSQIAENIDVAVETVSRWRNAQRNISMDKLLDIAYALGIEPEILFMKSTAHTNININEDNMAKCKKVAEAFEKNFNFIPDIAVVPVPGYGISVFSNFNAQINQFDFAQLHQNAEHLAEELWNEYLSFLNVSIRKNKKSIDDDFDIRNVTDQEIVNLLKLQKDSFYKDAELTQ